MSTDLEGLGADKILENVFQGQCKVTADPRTVLSTVLGSCVAACIYDPVAKVGGMNHFLLPESQDKGSTSMRYGAHSMEVLLNEIFKLGATRGNILVKIAGGAQISSSSNEIGSRNAAFVRDFLRNEGYPVQSESLGGANARRVLFHPASGVARVKIVSLSAVTETPPPPPPPPVRTNISLF